MVLPATIFVLAGNIVDDIAGIIDVGIAGNGIITCRLYC
jgi:hypothetical protein